MCCRTEKHSMPPSEGTLGTHAPLGKQSHDDSIRLGWMWCRGSAVTSTKADPVQGPCHATLWPQAWPAQDCDTMGDIGARSPQLQPSASHKKLLARRAKHAPARGCPRAGKIKHHRKSPGVSLYLAPPDKSRATLSASRRGAVNRSTHHGCPRNGIVSALQLPRLCTGLLE